MKKLVLFLSLFIVTVLLSAAIVSVFNTSLQATVAYTALFEVSFYALTYFNIIPMPSGIFGEYIGAPGASSSNGAGVQVLNTERARGAYMTLRTNPEYAGKDITDSYLRFETLISNSSNKLSFKTYVGDGTTQTPTEKRLDRNDKFVITSWGFFLIAQPVGKSNGRLHSYPNLTDFTPLVATVAPDLESIFNGELVVTINRKKVVPAYDMQRFLQVPETQQSAATNRDQRDFHKLLVPLTPHVEIDGSGTNEIEVTFPSHAAWTGGTPAAGFAHYACLYAHGMLITGGSANI